MKIVMRLELDNPTQMPFWSAMVTHNKEPLMKVVSKTFDPRSKDVYKERFRDAALSVFAELEKEKDQKMIKHLLLNEPENEN